MSNSSMKSRETIKARQQRLGTLPRACEACKIRKIRCDRAVPCSNCRASDLACQNVGADANDRPESRTSAGKIRQLESQVGILEQRLLNLEAKAATPALRSSELPARTEENLITRESNLPHSEEELRPLEGEPSFAAHAAQASEAVEMGVNDASGGSGLRNTLGHLNTVLQPLTLQEDYSFHSSISRVMPNIKLLPTALVIGILQRFKTRRPIFLSSYAVNDLQLVESLCQNIYFPMASISIGQVTSMHGIFYCLLKEYEAMKDPLCQQFDFSVHLAQCEKNFIMGLETYEIMAVPSFDNILGLTMGAIKAQGEAKPFLYSSLISAAATHCQTLGYHRDATYQRLPVDKAENIRRLFWTVYVFDKNSSLLLGRATQIQDCEIDTRYPSLPMDASLRPWDESFLLGIKLAGLQGTIYRRLYSASTTSKSSFERAEAINDLSSSMQQWRVELESIDCTGVNNPQVFALTRGNWDIMYYSTLTSLFRASSPPGAATEISSSCFKSANLSLKSHLNCFPKYQEARLLSESDYVNCVLLFSSFSPFIVTFLHAVASKSSEDLQILQDVVHSLEGVREASQASRRLYRICSAFSQLAKHLSQETESSIGIYNHENDSLLLSSGSSQPTFQPDLFQESLGADFTEFLGPAGACDIIDGWTSRQPLSMSIFDVNSMVE